MDEKRICHKYTLEEDNWIKSNIQNFSWKDLRSKFNETFGTSVSVQSIVSHSTVFLNMHRTKEHVWTYAENVWIKANLDKLSYSDLTEEFNREFQSNIKDHQMIHHVLYQLNLHKSNCHSFTKEQENWLKDNIDFGTYEEITDEFNKTFSTSLKPCSLYDKVIKRLKLHKNINRGCFSKGERRCTNVLPVGSEVFNGQDVYVKISDTVNDCIDRRMPDKHNDANWRRKDHIVWEQNGNEPIKDSSELLIHLDGDKQNCEINNLYKTTRKINFMLSKNKWHSSDPDVTLAAIKWCELFYALNSTSV